MGGIREPDSGTYASVRATPRTFYPESYGALGDGQEATAAASSSGVARIDLGVATTAAEVGKIILVQGAGVAGADLQTTVASWSGSFPTSVTLTVAPSTSVSVGQAQWGTDDAVAIQATYDAAWAALGGTVQFQAAMYVTATAPRTDRGGNAIIALNNTKTPSNTTGGRVVRFIGMANSEGSWPNDAGAAGGTRICALNLGLAYDATNGPPSVIGGPTYERGATFTVQTIVMRDLSVEVPSNPSLGGVDLSYVTRVEVGGVHVQARCTVSTAQANSTGTAQPTHAHAFGFYFPRRGNYDAARVSGGVIVDGFYVGIVVSEHFTADQVTVDRNIIGVAPAPNGDQGHAIVMPYLSAEWNQYVLSGWTPATGVINSSNKAYFDLVVDVEDGVASWFLPVYHLNDPANTWKGRVRFMRLISAGSVVSGPLKRNGAYYLQQIDITQPFSRVLDASFGAAHGMLAGTINTVPSLVASGVAGFGNALSFPGTAGNADTTSVVNLGIFNSVGTAAFTVECWFKRGRTGVAEDLVSKWGAAAATNDFTLYIDATNHPSFAVANSAGTTVNVTGSTTVAETTTWHHLAATWDGTTVTVWLDGVSIGTAAMAAKRASSLTTVLRLGSQQAGTAPFQGFMDEVRISSGARYTVGFTPSTTPFVPDATTLGLWHLDSLAA